MVTQTDMLNLEECARVAADVHALRPYWVPRHATAPFFTFGAASYLDGDTQRPEVRQQYYAKAARYNPVLIERFGWLYDRLLSTLERELRAPCAFEERLGRPGFHIFLPDKAFENPVYSIHFDLQYLQVDWVGHAAPDFSRPLSFTVSVVLPRSGGGLQTWDFFYADWKNKPLPELMVEVQKRAPHFSPYKVGGLAMHDGHMVHQIAPMRDIDPGNPADARITLQGHGIQSDGVWRLYW
jgi:hypothetical protein